MRKAWKEGITVTVHSIPTANSPAPARVWPASAGGGFHARVGEARFVVQGAA